MALSNSISARKSLFDSFGRVHNYLRISLTERCNLRCKYCMPEEGVVLAKQQENLKLEELFRLSSVFVRLCGINKIRLTGGEPTVDRKLVPLLNFLQTLRGEGLQSICMTTNGLTLKRHAVLYRDSGLDSINVSLDTLHADRYELMSRRKGWSLVMDGIKQALEVGFDQVKLNCVVIRNFNDDELIDFCNMAFVYPVQVRFIEFMPFLGNRWKRNSLVSREEMLEIIQQKFPDFKRVPSMEAPHDTSRIYKAPGMLGSIGFISSMTKNFCSSCNRLRLTSDGQLKVCLFEKRELSLKDLIRNGATDEELIVSTESALSSKKRQHAGLGVLERNVYRPMIKIEDTHAHARGLHNQSTPRATFSHLSERGEAKMINIEQKPSIRRSAIARGEIFVGLDVLSKIRAKTIEKGDIITVAKIAGILGAKQTSNLIPMCHQVPLDHVEIEIKECAQSGSLLVEASVISVAKTGVEMECLLAVSVTLLTIYDMCKSATKSMLITNIKVLSKRKG